MDNSETRETVRKKEIYGRMRYKYTEHVQRPHYVAYYYSLLSLLTYRRVYLFPFIFFSSSLSIPLCRRMTNRLLYDASIFSTGVMAYV